MDGYDCKTGEPYVEKKMPGWCWIFIILNAANFFLLVGGAIGGAIGGAFAALTICMSAAVAANPTKTVVNRVLSCIGIYVGASIIEFIVASILWGII